MEDFKKAFETNKVLKIVSVGALVLLVLYGISYFSKVGLIGVNRVEISESVEPSVAVDKIAPDNSVGYAGRDIIDLPPYYNPGTGDGSEVVKNSSITVKVTDLDSKIEEVKSSVKDNLGYIQSINDSGVDNSRMVYMTVRVPSANLSSFLENFKKNVVEVSSMYESSYDVSDSYYDLKSRLENEQELEKQYLSLLKTAKDVSDILKIQSELANVRSQIEGLEKSIKDIDGQVKMSTLTISMSKASVALDINDKEFSIGGEFKEALVSLVNFGKELLRLGVWTIVYAPIIIVASIIIYVIVKRNRRSK